VRPVLLSASRLSEDAGILRRMANLLVSRSDLFPSGTVVKAYLRRSFHLSQTGGFGSGTTGAPSGPVEGSGTMAGSPPTVEIEGLVAGGEYTLAAEVAGAWVYLAAQVPAAVAVPGITGLPEPSLQGLLAWAYDPWAIGANSFKLTTAGTLYVARVPIKEAMRVTNILLYTTVAGGTLTAAQNFIGLFAGGTRALAAKVSAAETIVKWEAAQGLLTIPLEAPVNVPGGSVEIGMFYNGTTAPTLAAGPATPAALANAGETATPKNARFSTGDTALTTALPNPITETQTVDAAPIWVGLS
jgi:hypothetical protein